MVPPAIVAELAILPVVVAPLIVGVVSVLFVSVSVEDVLIIPVSTTFVPSANNTLTDLSAATKVYPVPLTVLN